MSAVAFGNWEMQSGDPGDHLLLDREHGDELAIATGPWAPVGIEQRANAFAAAFLMPTWLLKDALSAAEAPADKP